MTTKLALTGFLAVGVGVVATYVVTMLNGTTDEFVMGALGGVALIAAAYKTTTWIWRLK